MPRNTETYDLAEELERIDNELDEIADEAAELRQDEWENSFQKEQYEDKVQEGNMLEQQYVGVQWALGEFDDLEVTVGGLTTGEYAEVGDAVEAHRKAAENHYGSNASIKNTRRMYFAAAGVVDGPFVGDEIGPRTRLNEKVQCVNGHPPQFMHWLEDRVDELTTPDVEGNGFATRLEERVKMTMEQPSPSGELS